MTKSTLDHRLKWEPIRSFEGIYKAFKGGDWEVWLSLTTRGDLEGKEYVQDYALIITLEDITSDMENRVDLHSLISNSYESYVMVRPRTRIKVK